MAKNIQRESKFPGLMKNVPTTTTTTPEHEHENVYKHEYEHKHEHEYAPKKETRTKRVNLLIRPSVYDRLDHYAKVKGVSRNSLIENLIEELLSSEGF